MSEHYILNEAHEVVPAELLEWARWFEDFNNRRVRLTRIGPYYVSTVFMGLNHSWEEDGPPLVFETMVYIKNRHTVKFPEIPEAGIKGWEKQLDSEFLDTQERCSTWDEAIVQHERVIEDIRNPGDDLEEIDERVYSDPTWLKEHVADV